MTKIRWRMRWLLTGLMLTGVLWIQVQNWLSIGQSPLMWLREDPVGMSLTYAGALVIGLLLDGLAGRELRPFFVTMARLEKGAAVSARERERSADLAMRFPAVAALRLLVTASLGILAFHTHQAILDGNYATRDFWVGLYGSVASELTLSLLLALLLYTLGGRLLHRAVAAHALQAIPAGRRFPVGLQFLLMVVLQAVMYTALYLNAATPPATPVERQVWLYLLLAAMTGLMGYLVGTGTGRDLSALAAQLRALAGGVRPGLFDRIPVTGRDETGEIAEAINMLQDRVEREFQAIERDLQAARSIQTELLPHLRPLPDGWDLAARLLPAKEVGGDFYDVIALPDGRLGIALGDAAGNGLPAALLMASTVSLLRSHAPLQESPGAVLSAVNRLLASSLPPATFVTVAYAVLDLKTRAVTLASAGHLPPMVGGREAESVGALPLGVDPDTVVADQRFTLEPGEALVLLSDGVPEARDPAGCLLGDAGISPLVARRGQTADELAESLIAAALTHGGGAPQDDDMTVLVLKAPAELRLELPSRHGVELTAARAAADFARLHGPLDRVEDIATAVTEACLNAAVHGNLLRPEIPVILHLWAGPEAFEATVTDAGQLFTPPAAAPDLAAQMEGEGPIRGWGFHLIRSTADEVWLEPLAHGKQIHMRFYRRGELR
jgi:serine phosphatase RsbU (regulator of sigma subunit)